MASLKDEAVHVENVQEFARMQEEFARLQDQLDTLLGRLDAFAVKLRNDPLATSGQMDEAVALRQSVNEARQTVVAAKAKVKA